MKKFILLLWPALLFGQTHIYRSIQPGITGALAVGTSNALTITDSTATFTNALPDTIGIGDAVVIDSSNSGSKNALLYIRRRVTSKIFIVKRWNGSAGATCSGDTDWDIRRGYTSLANADAGTENTGISVTTADAGNLNLVTRNEVWHFILYPGIDGTATIDGWTTGASNYIRVYSPCSSSEVGASQRHNRKATGRNYKIKTTSGTTLQVNDDSGTKVTQHLYFDGFQIEASGVSGGTGIQVKSENGSSDFRISNCIFIGSDSASTTGTNHLAIDIFSASSSAGVHRIWNNIIYGWKTAGSTTNEGGIFVRPTPTSGTAYIYSNTIYKCEVGVKRATAGTTVTPINNITNRCADGWNGSFTSPNYNISDLAADASGANSLNSTTVTFTSQSTGDFTLSVGAAAINVGTDLSADANISFNYDAGDYVRTGTWDIGAAEYGATGSCRVQAASNPPDILPTKSMQRLRRTW